MAYLILIPAEHARAYVVETQEDVCRATLTYLPTALVEDWLLRAGTADVIWDQRGGSIQVVKLGDITDASVIEASRVAKEKVADAIEATTEAVKALKGAR